MSNATWVCFHCRWTVRRPTSPRKVVRCPTCQEPCFCLGRKIPVPPKAKIAAWTKLRKEMQALIIDWRVRVERAAVARRHEIERRIRDLESKPKEASRLRQIKKLQEELAGG
jgi:hypothetical protein